jgi:hypothetical protein
VTHRRAGKVASWMPRSQEVHTSAAGSFQLWPHIWVSIFAFNCADPLK